MISTMTGLSFELVESALRTTHPTKVVTVFMYTSPVSSSFITCDVQTLEIPGVATTPIDVVLSNASWSVSLNSDALRQDITSANPLGVVGGFDKASAHGEGEDVGSGRALGGQDGWVTVAVQESSQDFLLGLGTGVGGGISPAMYTS